MSEQRRSFYFQIDENLFWNIQFGMFFILVAVLASFVHSCSERDYEYKKQYNKEYHDSYRMCVEFTRDSLACEGYHMTFTKKD